MQNTSLRANSSSMVAILIAIQSKESLLHDTKHDSAQRRSVAVGSRVGIPWRRHAYISGINACNLDYKRLRMK